MFMFMSVFVVGLIIWLLYLFCKKVGLFGWFRTTWLHQTKPYQMISFILKVYIYPLSLVKQDKEVPVPKVQLSTNYGLLWVLYLFTFMGVVVMLCSTADEYLELSSLQKGDIKVVTGKVHQLTGGGFRSSPSVRIKLEDPKEERLVLSYLIDKSIMEGFKGKQAIVKYIVAPSTEKKLITITIEGKQYGSVQAAIVHKQDRLKGFLEFLTILFLIPLILPWFFYKKYGLVRFLKSNND